ncbi:RHS repeat domain-containing protein [Ferruginibacter profundus]
MVLKVMAGDKLDLLAKSWYEYAGGTVTNSAFSAGDLITAFLGTSGGSNPAAQHGGTYSILNGNTSGTVTPLNNFITNSSNTNPYNGVKAGVCYILFDEQFNLVSCQFDPVYIKLGGFKGATGGPDGGLKNHMLQNINVPKNGYLYVYCSNESNINVFFDNLEVVHTRGQILEETSYYPFGLTMVGISSKAAGTLENKRKFNGGTELNNDFDINLYETQCRSYDPQIGRFLQVDELADANWEWTPYNFGLDNPINLNDPKGLVDEDPKKKKDPVYYTPGTNMAGVTVIGHVKVLTQAQVQDFHTRLEYAGIGIDKVKNRNYRAQLERYDDIYKFMVKVHADIKQDGLNLLEGLSWFIPAGQITKLRYLKFAGTLFKLKRGGVVAKISSTFFTELGKNILAKNGKFGDVDWNDVLINTATSKFNIFGKIVAKTWNSAVDISYSHGQVSVFNERKSYTSAGIDLLFNYVKLGAKSLAEPNQPTDAVNTFDILMDQSKNLLKDGIK